ncbi:hypothetical protein J8281_02400 [Aquimarina sp. U1-2]|uniref:hypothetical protein n=1 Tax=Aquimarina sp. U1-2 TaxID=2823141 RepID=UPI001AED0DB5|nr:hypothetical protein [Aquimarina sp. U1-2]MBP2831026.1 hypothetical protein [Aquimarina sp. U1-2]
MKKIELQQLHILLTSSLLITMLSAKNSGKFTATINTISKQNQDYMVFMLFHRRVDFPLESRKTFNIGKVTNSYRSALIGTTNLTKMEKCNYKNHMFH